MLRDVGQRVIRQGDDGVRRPLRGGRGRTRPGGLGRPPSEVMENAPYDRRIVDEGDDAHRPLAPWTLQRIGFIDFANQPRPGRLGARGECAHGINGCRARGRRIVALLSLGTLPGRAVGVLADVAHQVEFYRLHSRFVPV